MNDVMSIITDFSNTLKYCSITVVFVNPKYFDLLMSMNKDGYYLFEGDYKFFCKTKEELLQKVKTYLDINEVENIEIVGNWSRSIPGTLVYNNK